MEKLKLFFKNLGSKLYAVLLALLGVLLAVVGIQSKSLKTKKETIKKQEAKIKNNEIAQTVQNSTAETTMNIKDKETERLSNVVEGAEDYNKLIEDWNK